MLTKLKTEEELIGKTIAAVEKNIYGMALKFSDNTYGIFVPTTNEEVVLDAQEGVSFYDDTFSILKSTNEPNPQEILSRYSNYSRELVQAKERELIERYPTRSEFFSKAIETAETLLNIEGLSSPTFRSDIKVARDILIRNKWELSVEGYLTGIARERVLEHFTTAVYLFYCLEG